MKLFNFIALCLSVLALIIAKRNTVATQAKAFDDEGEYTYTYCVEPCNCGGGVSFGTYPVFQIPLDGLRGFCDFELKASTNNFSTEVGHVYWFDSLGTTFPHWVDSLISDKQANVFFCNPDNTDSRKYVKWLLSASLCEQIGTANTNYQHTVLISPSHAVSGADVWMKENNDRLTWVYRRRTTIGGEQNPLTNKSIWHPIVPMYWRSNSQFNPILE